MAIVRPESKSGEYKMRVSLTSAKSIFFAIAATAMVFLIVASADAGRADRNGDGIPDRWAKKHGLNAKKNQANRDQDHDKVQNICEYEAGMDPRDRNSDNDRRRDGREDSDDDGMVNSVESVVDTDCGDSDSDGDGTDDGDEVSGFVHAFDGDILKIRMVDGTILSAPVTEATYVHCEQDEYKDKPAADDGEKSDDDSKESEEAEVSGVRAAQGDGSYDASNCGFDALTVGRVVKAFYVEDGVFVKIKLLDR